MAAIEEEPESSRPLRTAQESFVEQKDRLLRGLAATKTLLSDTRDFYSDSWTVRYPRLRVKSDTDGPSPKHRGIHHLSFVDSPSSETDVVLNRSTAHSFTLESISVAQEDASDESPLDSDGGAGGRLAPVSQPDFQVLRLDLNLGSPGASTRAGALVSQLERCSIAKLVDERMAVSVQHIDKLRVRVEDTSSKVLVTGDVNAGKSTFVNSLLRRAVMPVDQQPCTRAFCEVHDFSENGGVEEVHVVKDAGTYDVNDESTYKRASLSDLDHITDDMDDERECPQGFLKLYLDDSRPLGQPLLSNGVVDISLIDAPGLNRDRIQTTALFARQEEIDVVVFVVSAENHLTESAKSFLRTASNEKAYVFVVVNKFDQIKNKEKCRRMVLEQIRELIPRTYEDANDLVHFVDSLIGKDDPSFEDLEAALRSFVLVKRAKSKLNPVSTYLSHLLSDIELLVSANVIVAQEEIARARCDLDAALPVLERMKRSHEVLEEALETVEEQGVRLASGSTQRVITDALDRIGQGLPGVELASVRMPLYPGLLNIWDYARDVRKVLLTSLDEAVKCAEGEVRSLTTQGVQRILSLGEEHLPVGVERSRRVFIPEAMFSSRRTRDGKRTIRQNGCVVAGGTLGLGIGLAARSELCQPAFFDIFDAPHYFWLCFGELKPDGEDESGPSSHSLMSVCVGAVTVISGQMVARRAAAEAAALISDALSHETARKWAPSVFGALIMGATTYLVLGLPESVPRTVGRRIRKALLIKPKNGQGRTQEQLFVGAHAARAARETRKVLRLAAWDLRECLRVATEERSREVRGAEEMECRALRAKEWFTGVTRRTADVREQAGLVSMS